MVELSFFGGVKEIGGNKVLLKAQHGSIFLDFGLSYKQNSNYFESYLKPRSKSMYYDLANLNIIPKLDGIYRKDLFCPEDFSDCTSAPGFWQSSVKSYDDALTEPSWHPDAIFISHAHADHCGQLPYLGNIPVYCSEITWKLMKSISQIGNLSGFDDELTFYKTRIVKTRASGAAKGKPYIASKAPKDRDKKFLQHDTPLEIAQDLKITAYNVSHSIPGSMCCIIEADNKKILYTGDLRFHGRDPPDLSKLDDLEPDVMITEGTRVDDNVPDNETKVEQDLEARIKETEGLVMVGFSWKDLDRYESVKNAARNCDRTPVFDPRLAYLLARLDKNVYDDHASVFVERCENMLYSHADYTKACHKASLVDKADWKTETEENQFMHLEKGTNATDINENPDQYVLHLDYYRFKNLLDFNLPPGSVYIRAQCEPFNPEMELSEDRMIRWLKHFKLNEENDNEPYQIHASSHASGPELQELIDRVKPKMLIPIHTENPMLFSNDAGTVYEAAQNTPIQI